MKSHRKHAPELDDSKIKRKHKHKTLGRKQRLDELRQAEKDLLRYLDWEESCKARKAYCIAHHEDHTSPYHCPFEGQWVEKERKRLQGKVDELWQSALKDGLV